MKTWQTAKEVHTKSDVLYNIEVKIWRMFKKLISNLTRWKIFNSKSDKTKKFWFKIMLFRNIFLFKIMPFRKIFFSKIKLFKKNFFIKIVHFNFARKTQNLRILRGKMSQNVIFWVQKFFKICLLKIIFSSKSSFLKIFFSSKSCFLKINFLQKTFFLKNKFLKNLARRKIFNSKSDALYKIDFRIWHVAKILIQNLTRCKNFSPKSDFCLAFEVLTEWWYLLSMLTPTSLKEEN